jgi:TonB family protein
MLVSYMPPPNPELRMRGADETRETLRYVELAPEGFGAGFGTAQVRADRPPVQSQGQEAGNLGQDSTTAPATPGSEGTDSVYTIIDVDTAATRLAESAAPQYPAELLEKRLEGQAIVQFIVDTNGRADTASFRVMLASHTAFAQSVREALPEMRFTTARIGPTKVRQLVELPFNFKVILPATDSGTTVVRRTGARPK